MRSTGGLFRGSEFPRLLLLASILVVGWAAFYVWHNRNEERLPPREVQENPLPQPEDRVEFHGIVDKRPLIPRECAAYKLLVDLVREGAFAPGSKLLYAHLGGQPALNAYTHIV